jgi:methylglyoxal/glyoxal reductase
MPGSINDTFTLTNGAKMPMLGLGTYKTPEGSTVEEAVKMALEMGYRHVDTAALYANEKGVGNGVRKSGVPRKDVFVTTKCWNDDIRKGYDGVLKALDKSLKLLGFDYVDCYLLHWPIVGKDKEGWKAMEKIYAEGKAKSIGVSNYAIKQLDDLNSVAKVKPMVNQVEFHPTLMQKPLLAYSKKHGIAHEAWAPLMQGKGEGIPTLQEVAKKHGKSVAQVLLRWDIQHGVVTIPKSIRRERIKENTAIYDFELSPAEMAKIDALDQGKRIGPDPENFNF